MRTMLELDGRVALVTGGSRGLGLQLAEALGEMGARLALVARRSAELESARAHLGTLGIEAQVFACDLGDAAAIPHLADKVMQGFGQVDILVNNAGAAWGAPAETHPLDAWQKVINLNLTGTFVLTQEVANASMIPRRTGKIINIASIAGLVGTPVDVLRGIAYNTSKGGLVNFTRSLAAEWGQYGINVNAIAPGYFQTRMSKGVIHHAHAAILAGTPLGRLGGEEDLKGAVALLASDAGSFITGQIISVDGGMSAI
ncbi:MAG: SDR family oxidoreductase [Rhodocyclales bacterium]|nr:SDR family oxidoreductase [Rhodocyclales bacterium]